MQFRLIYSGPLKAGGKDRAHIHEVRRHLRPQLADLWSFPPLSMASTEKVTAARIGHDDEVPSINVAGKCFQPLVYSEKNLLAELDILFLRPEVPGRLFSTGGDLDNRIKTLFDALKPPDENQAVNLDLEHDPDPFHVLLEDDKLIVGFTVETDRLFSSPLNEESQANVHLVITVRITATHAHMDNLHLLGP